MSNNQASKDALVSKGFKTLIRTPSTCYTWIEHEKSKVLALSKSTHTRPSEKKRGNDVKKQCGWMICIIKVSKGGSGGIGG